MDVEPIGMEKALKDREDDLTASPVERGVMPYEPYGGNLYRPHKLMVTSGEFWRCEHGLTGYESGLIWTGCAKCAESDPEAFKEWKKA